MRGYDAMQIGLAFLPMTLIVAVLSSGPTARLVNRFGAKRTLVPGLAAMAAGLALLAGAGEHTAFFPTLFFTSRSWASAAGRPSCPLHIAMGDMDARDAGLASGMVNVSMWISASVGLAALSAIAADRTKSLAAQGHTPAASLTGGYDLAFLIGAALVAAGVVVAIVVLPGGEREEREPEGEIEAALG